MMQKIRRLFCPHALKKRYDGKAGDYVYQCVICGAVFRRVRRGRDNYDLLRRGDMSHKCR